VALCCCNNIKNSLLGIAVYHRLGSVPVGQISIAIAVSSPHRQHALQACHWLIDELKATVPIWKKEWYSDGSSNWKQNDDCCWSARKPAHPDHDHDHHHDHHHHHDSSAAASQVTTTATTTDDQTSVTDDTNAN
jgi:hypothetical protein